MSAPQFTLLIRNGIHECAPDHSIEKITVGALRKAAADMAELYEALEAVVPALEAEIKSLAGSFVNRIGPHKGKVTDPDGLSWIAEFQEPLDKIRAALAKAVRQ